MIITNQRIVHLDWITPFKYVETQATLDDVQNIECSENGFLSKFHMFDFGLFLVETASTRTVISFPEAPDPEGIKFFVTNMARKHMRLAANCKTPEKRPIPPGNMYNIHHTTDSESSKVATNN